jgi:hypothetical protein
VKGSAAGGVWCAAPGLPPGWTARRLGALPGGSAESHDARPHEHGYRQAPCAFSILAQVSRRPTVRFTTRRSAVVSGSTLK